jgi:hypothetical protein
MKAPKGWRKIKVGEIICHGDMAVAKYFAEWKSRTATERAGYPITKMTDCFYFREVKQKEGIIYDR